MLLEHDESAIYLLTSMIKDSMYKDEYFLIFQY
jgi:hypothetical protein